MVISFYILFLLGYLLYYSPFICVITAFEVTNPIFIPISKYIFEYFSEKSTSVLLTPFQNSTITWCFPAGTSICVDSPFFSFATFWLSINTDIGIAQPVNLFLLCIVTCMFLVDCGLLCVDFPQYSQN